MRKMIPFVLLFGVLFSACVPSSVQTPDAGGKTPVEKPGEPPEKLPADDVLLRWERQGGLAGFCDSLDVLLDGSFTFRNCKGARLDGRLSESQAELLSLYAGQFAPFAEESGDPAVMDAMTLRLLFQGTGTEEAGAAEKQAIGALAADIAAIARFNAQPDPERDAARQALETFLSALNSGDFILAAKLYGGETESLEMWNPDVPNNLPVWLENGCTRNGLQCLPVRSILYRGPDARGGYQFLVEFTAPDGGLFHQGPCCGDESGGPFPASFVFAVIKSGENWQVLDLPPYMP